MTDIVIVAATRTAIGKFGGALAKIPAPELGATVIRELLARAKLQPDQISEVILGQVLAAGSGQNPARQALIKAGLPAAIPAMTINKVCGSGLKAVMLAAQALRCGDAEIVIAGGQENMSAAPHVLPGSRDGFRMGDAKLVDTMIVDGLWDVFNQYHMGTTAENVAKQYGISRAQQDQFSVASQNKAEAAQKAGMFKDEIVPVMIPQRKGDPLAFAADEFIKVGTTLESISGLRPGFRGGLIGDAAKHRHQRRRRGVGRDEIGRSSVSSPATIGRSLPGLRVDRRPWWGPGSGARRLERRASATTI